MSVLLTVTTAIPLGEFSRNVMFEYFSELCEENQVPLKFDIYVTYFIKDLNEFIVIFRQFLKYEMFQANFIKNHESHSILCLIFFFEITAHLK
jgi:hypothetical protein